MNIEHSAKTGLESLLDALESRFVIDAKGRLCASRNDGILPRFVLGRATEGCLWRFAADLDGSQIRSVAKLAGREKGCTIEGESTAPPERLVMIGRLLREGDVPPVPRREFITDAGKIVGELWSLD